MYCLTWKTLKCNSFVEKVCMFLQKETSHCKNSLVLGYQGPKQYIFGNYFYSNNARTLRFKVFPCFMLVSMSYVLPLFVSLFYLKWTKFTRNCKFCSSCKSPETRTKLKQILNFLWIRSTSGKIIISYIS